MPSFPAWFYVPCSAALIVGALCSVTILFEVLRRRQHMAIMSIVWPVCPLFGTVSEAKSGDTAVSPLPSVRRPGPFTAAVLADSVMWLPNGWLFSPQASRTRLVGIRYSNDKTYAIWTLDLRSASAFGIVFHYFAIAPMRNRWCLGDRGKCHRQSLEARIGKLDC